MRVPCPDELPVFPTCRAAETINAGVGRLREVSVAYAHHRNRPTLFRPLHLWLDLLRGSCFILFKRKHRRAKWLDAVKELDGQPSRWLDRDSSCVPVRRNSDNLVVSISLLPDRSRLTRCYWIVSLRTWRAVRGSLPDVLQTHWYIIAMYNLHF